MNPTQLRALIWLRWRLTINQMRKGGFTNSILLSVLVAGCFLGAAFSFFIALVVAYFTIASQSPSTIMFVWDGLVCAFIFMWMTSILAEIQRSEMVSLGSLLQYPISLSGAFVLNYLTSLLSLSMLYFVPVSAGLYAAAVIRRGFHVLPLAMHLLAFIFMMSAVAYQLRGWLASLMLNKRRQRTIVAGFTILFVIICQIPYVAIQFSTERPAVTQARLKAQQDSRLALSKELSEGTIDHDTYVKQSTELERRFSEENSRSKFGDPEKWQRSILLANQWLPVGWLGYGAYSLELGNWLAASLSLIGMLIVGCVCMQRAYLNTIRLHTGVLNAKQRKSPNKVSSNPSSRNGLIDWSIPWISEQASTVAMTNVLTLLRSPEAKMMMLSPIILLSMVIVLAITRSAPMISDVYRPFASVLGLMLYAFSLSMISMNIFGFDRSGFRSFVLLPISRRDILIGKNISIAPAALVGALVVVTVSFVLAPYDPLFFVASLFQAMTLSIGITLIGNTVSIFFAVSVQAGSGSPNQANLRLALVYLVANAIGMTLILPSILMIGSEIALKRTTGMSFLPIYLVLSVAEFGLAVWLYRVTISYQAVQLQSAETTVLEKLVHSAE